MKQEKRRFFAFLFFDAAGVTAYLNRMAESGWAFMGREGRFTGRFQETQRQELRYLVLPVQPDRSEEELHHQVIHYQQLGWEPIDTLWGMDIYASSPCREPDAISQTELTAIQRGAALNWLRWSLLFLLITWGAVGFLLSRTEALTAGWYLYDSRAMLTLLLLLGGSFSVYWLIRVIPQAFGAVPTAPQPRPLLFFDSLFFSSLLVSLFLTLFLLWAEPIPVLWGKGLAALAFLAVLTAIPKLFQGDDRKKLFYMGIGLALSVLLTALMGMTLKPLSLDSQINGSGWRNDPKLTAAVDSQLLLPLSTEAKGQLLCYYDRDESLLLIHDRYQEYRPDGSELQSHYYFSWNPFVLRSLERDLMPEGLSFQGSYAVSQTEHHSHLWIKDGMVLRHISTTLPVTDWQPILDALS